MNKSYTATMAAVCLAAALVSPAHAADPATLPGVTVTATRNPGETPVEAAYTTTLSQRLEKFARYPTGRDASVACPSGTSTIWFELARSGKVVGHGVESTSGSQILDQRAVELAIRAKYAMLPQDAWAGDAAKHRFVVSYKFDCNAATAPKAAPKKG
jgi:outer membrane biosynthesis protein TonB